ncbi:MAG: hypothetical protein IT203_06450 [Fimbriimonadaceae bacterium]|nr:hypothetical protein [Fimbriimonadaceae bacterium]
MTDHDLDERLESPAQSQMREMLKSMPEDTVSMAWRSGLNERIASAVAVKQRRRRFAWVLSPALGLGLAGALAITMLTKAPTSPNLGQPAKPSIESNLVASFRDSMNYTNVTGVGLNPDEVARSRSISAVYDPDEVDFDSL